MSRKTAIYVCMKRPEALRAQGVLIGLKGLLIPEALRARP